MEFSFKKKSNSNFWQFLVKISEISEHFSCFSAKISVSLENGKFSTFSEKKVKFRNYIRKKTRLFLNFQNNFFF